MPWLAKHHRLHNIADFALNLSDIMINANQSFGMRRVHATNPIEHMRPNHLHIRNFTLPASITALLMFTPYATFSAPIAGDTVNANLTVTGWGKFTNGVDLGPNGEALFNWLPADPSNPLGTTSFDIALAQGAFLWRDSITPTPAARNKMRLDPSNNLTLYAPNGTTGLLLNPADGKISILATGTNSGIFFGNNSTPTLKAATNGAAIFPSLVTLQNGLQLTNGSLQISATTLATSSTTGALTVTGGIGAGKDSYFNGVRVGRGGGNYSCNTVIGSASLASNTCGTNNTAVGASSLYSNSTGNFNTASGPFALYSNSTGNFNTASGPFSLYSNSTGYYNTATGPFSLYSNSTGYYNTATGPCSLYSNSTGYYNTATGAWALYTNSTGYFNSAFGQLSLYSNTAGYYNTASGTYSLYGNTTGHENTATGYYSLYTNTTGTFNSASGAYSLYANNTGTYNSASGAYALNMNSTGSYNTASGGAALRNNSTGSYNTASGVSALYATTTGSTNTATGTYALSANTTGTGNTALGYQAANGNTFGANNVAVGSNAGIFQANGSTPLTDPDGSIYIGANVRGKDNNDSNSIVLGANAIGEGANTTVIGNSSTAKTHIYGELVATSATIGGSPILAAKSGTGAVLSNSATLAIGNSAIATQTNAIAIGQYSQALGYSALALGDSAYAPGSHATAFQQSNAFGYMSLSANWGSAIGDYSVGLAFGQASGTSSIAIGGYDQEWAIPNHAYGAGSVALGGRVNIAYANFSYAMGSRVTSSSACCFAVGSQNLSASYSAPTTSLSAWLEDSPILEVGNGSPNTPIREYSNAITTLKNGQTTLTNKAWKANPSTPLADPVPSTDSGGNALVVEGHTVLKGKVVIEQVQGDISMGIYGAN